MRNIHYLWSLSSRSSIYFRVFSFKLRSVEEKHMMYIRERYSDIHVQARLSWKHMKSSFAKNTFKKWTDCRTLFSTYSTIWTLNMFCQKKLYCPHSRHHEFMFYCRSRQAPLFLNNKSILANQSAVFRSGDKLDVHDWTWSCPTSTSARGTAMQKIALYRKPRKPGIISLPQREPRGRKSNRSLSWQHHHSSAENAAEIVVQQLCR